ncbi:hypothetical protein BJY16_008100 [Actinoplanes octamycinicus]|uniref:Uncharacterized protein n=1 Tax=Actinoplanes octamycinicus TaxID=135948 RepID=A0A7W7H5Z4_9ACTN|nr:hypothetical protein [Actinoplanes octamycinicus]MBB4744641.1 hypothetical protein [Actinoplanes octamycinicus]GIE55222.1 hypothetical protein Aoc01nite_06240 [Actinoplanes octamycinicus]
MITLRAVVELDDLTWLHLDGDCPADRAGLFVGALAGINPDDPIAERVDAILTDETLIAQGGLALHDTVTGMSVHPGCCAGLEDWRCWAEVAAGESPWLGHSPEPRVQVLDRHLRVWQDAPGRGDHVDVTGAELRRLLLGLQRDLVAFLDVLRAWARANGQGGHADALAAAIDRHFVISAPLTGPGQATS